MKISNIMHYRSYCNNNKKKVNFSNVIKATIIISIIVIVLLLEVIIIKTANYKLFCLSSFAAAAAAVAADIDQQQEHHGTIVDSHIRGNVIGNVAFVGEDDVDEDNIKDFDYIDDEEDAKEPHIFSTDSFPDDERIRPTLSNGHIGFAIFGDSVYMNGLYNGHNGLSHRARIPNRANIQISTSDEQANDTAGSKTFSINSKTGIFRFKRKTSDYKIIHLVYAHRFYNRAIINEVHVRRLNSKGDIKIQVNQNAGNASEDITFNRKNIIRIQNQNVTSQCGYTNEVEDPYDDDVVVVADEYHQQHNQSLNITGKGSNSSKRKRIGKHVCVLWNHVPEEITLKKGMQVMSIRFVMTVDGVLSVAKQEMMDVLNDRNLLDSHIVQWTKFWSTFDIVVGGNLELSRAIYASIFYLISSLPSNETNIEKNPFYGLSPTGLGRGGSNLDDYEGHSFWDTEIWMLPSILIMNPKWSEELLHYRYMKLDAAKENAQKSGYKGARFPWESADTGHEVTQPCCPMVAQNQIHVTADISFALRNHFAATNDLQWLNREGCPIAREIAKFWQSRVHLNESIGFYDIKDVMGPDEDHDTVSNNVYTNIIAGFALYFGEFATCLCRSSSNNIHVSKNNILRNDGNNLYNTNNNWSNIAKHLKLLYNSTYDYHPQYDGYDRGTIIKQADTILIGYPLLYGQLNRSTKQNDLNYYENVTRKTGPAMTWAMHTINHLDLNDMDNDKRADVFFVKSYQNYIRQPFNVWSEVIDGEKGATNFLTGSGGFLQSILNGYAGLRVFIDRLAIANPRLPANVDSLSIYGINYLGSKFNIAILANGTSQLKCTFLNDNISLNIVYDEKRMNFTRIEENGIYNIGSHNVFLQRIDQSIFEKCKKPLDIIGIPIN